MFTRPSSCPRRLLPLRAGVALLALSLAAAQAPPVSSPVLLPGDAASGPVYGNEQAPALCPGGAGYLLVWNDGRSIPLGASTYQQSDIDLYGLLLDSAGAPAGEPFVIADSFGYQRNARVAWNGESWLVAWNDQASTPFYYTDAIKAVRVSAQGVVLDPAPIPLFGSGNTVALTANGSTWLAVAESYDGQTYIGLGAKRVAADGSVLDPDPVVLVPAQYYLYFNIDVLSAHGDYLLTWSGLNGQRARRFDASLAPLGAEFGLPGSRLASNGTDWFVAWNAGSLRASPIQPDGSLLVPAGVVVASGFDAYQQELDVAWSGTDWVVAWLHTYDAVRLARVTTAGAVLDPGGVVLDPGDDDFVYGMVVEGSVPGAGLVVAWSDIRNGGGYLYDVRGRHVSAAMVPGQESVLSTSVPAQVRVELAEYPGGFLAVYESRTSAGTRILAQRLSAGGTGLDAEPLVLASGDVASPTAAWNGRIFVVAWTDADGIRLRRLAADATPIDAASILAMPAGFSPDVAAIGESILVVGLKFGLNAQYINVHSARLDGLTGVVLDPVPPVIAGSYSLLPRVIALDGRWFAVWEQHGTHDDPQAFIKGCFIEPDGTASPSVPVYYSGGHPDVAWSGSEALIVFRTNSLANANNDVAYRRMLPDGTFPATQVLLTSAAGRQLYPVVAWNGSEFLAAWEDQRNQQTFYDGRTDVYAARVTAAGSLVDVGSFPIESSPRPEARPAVAGVVGTPGAAVVTSSLLLDQPGLHAWRLGSRLVGPAPLWSDQGDALAGSGLPFLAGDGALVAGSPLMLVVSGAATTAPVTLVVGLSALGLPFKGGVLVPTPDLLLGGLGTDAGGKLSLAGTWPSGVPAGTQLVLQAWIADAAGPAGLSSSNGLLGLVP